MNYEMRLPGYAGAGVFLRRTIAGDPAGEPGVDLRCFTARADVLESLGLASVAREANGHVIGRAVAADAMGATAVPGVLLAGNVADLFAGVINGASAGLVTAAAINADLVADDVRYAVEAVSGTVTR